MESLDVEKSLPEKQAGKPRKEVSANLCKSSIHTMNPNMEFLNAMKHDFAPVGLDMDIKTKDDGSADIELSYNPIHLRLCLRHAPGRRRTVFNTGYKWEQILELYTSRKKSGVEIAAMCRMSTSTFYRRLEHYLELGAPNDDFH